MSVAMSDEEDSATGLGLCFRALMDMSRILGSNHDCCSQIFVPVPAVRDTAKSTPAHGPSASVRSSKFACLDSSEELILRHTRINGSCANLYMVGHPLSSSPHATYLAIQD